MGYESPLLRESLTPANEHKALPNALPKERVFPKGTGKANGEADPDVYGRSPRPAGRLTKSPTHQRVISHDPAAVTEAKVNQDELAFRQRGYGFPRAFDGPLESNPAPIARNIARNGDGRVPRGGRWDRVRKRGAPALDGAVRPLATGIVPRDLDGYEHATGWRGLARGIVAPTDNLAAGPDATAGVMPNIHRGKLAGGRGSLAVPVVAPTLDGTIDSHTACVLVTNADGDVLSSSGCGLAKDIVSPADDGVVPHNCASVLRAEADRNETLVATRTSCEQEQDANRSAKDRDTPGCTPSPVGEAVYRYHAASLGDYVPNHAIPPGRASMGRVGTRRGGLPIMAGPAGPGAAR